MSCVHAPLCMFNYTADIQYSLLNLFYLPYDILNIAIEQRLCDPCATVIKKVFVYLQYFRFYSRLV